jgi:hypothetical protein
MRTYVLRFPTVSSDRTFTVSLLLSSSLKPDASTSTVSLLEKADMFFYLNKPFPLPIVVEFSSVRCFESKGFILKPVKVAPFCSK